MFGSFLRVFGGVSFVLGIMFVAGAAGDCDGACMELANDMPTLLTNILIGFILTAGGAASFAAGEVLSR